MNRPSWLPAPFWCRWRFQIPSPDDRGTTVGRSCVASWIVPVATVMFVISFAANAAPAEPDPHNQKDRAVESDDGGADSSDEGEDEERFAPGLLLRVTTLAEGADSPTSQWRLAATVSDHWTAVSPQSASVTESLEARRQLSLRSSPTTSPWEATWTGFLLTQPPSNYRLAVYFHGDVRVELAGRELLSGSTTTPRWIMSPIVPLEYDWHALQISLSTIDDQLQPMIQLAWMSDEFPWEPIPARQLFHETTPTAASAVNPRSDSEATPPVASLAREFRRGQQLVRTLRCAACHDIADDRSLLNVPTLDSINELDTTWALDWLSAPPQNADATRNLLQRRMPHFELSRRDAADVLAYLRTRPVIAASHDTTANVAEQAANAQPSGEVITEPNAEESRIQGQRLFATLGCLACHPLQDVGEVAGRDADEQPEIEEQQPQQSLFSGPDLTDVGRKRSTDYLVRWLLDPDSVNPRHRMPRFDLSAEEADQLSRFLTETRLVASGRSAGISAAAADESVVSADAARGAQLVADTNCANCHTELVQLRPEQSGEAAQQSSRHAPPIHAGSDWMTSCVATATARHPGYHLSPADIQAVKGYLAHSGLRARKSRVEQGELLLTEHQCVACHARDNATGLLTETKLATHWLPELAERLPAMLPPSLTSVGDKLTDVALHAAVLRKHPPVRDWLEVRMPHFPLSDGELQTLTEYFVVSDRVAAAHPELNSVLPPDSDLGVAQRLVTPDGFGCTSCHAIGKVRPKLAPLGAQGPNLSQLGQRIRREWFDRWVRNPARIVPRMEMPSVQIPVRGALNDDLSLQLAAVWDVLNRPGFSPPEADPVRVVRRSGIDAEQQTAVVLTDVMAWNDSDLIKPFLVGLPNRHNILLDLAQNRLVGWWSGDVARQRTQGKSWHWEPAGQNLWPVNSWGPVEDPTAGSDLQLVRRHDGRRFAPQVNGQFVTEPAQWTHRNGGVELLHRLRFALRENANPGATSANDNAQSGAASTDESLTQVIVRQTFAPLAAESHGGSLGAGWSREVLVTRVPAGFDAVLRVVTDDATTTSGQLAVPADSQATSTPLSTQEPTASVWSQDADHASWTSLTGRLSIRAYELHEPRGQILRGAVRGEIVLPAVSHTAPNEIETADAPSAGVGVVLDYHWALAADQFPAPPALPGPPAKEMDVVPGWQATQLPLAAEVMPTALAWRDDGALFIASLKGRVWLARDTDGDELEDRLTPFADEFAAPYGLYAGSDYVDVVNKYGLLRLRDQDRDDFAEQVELLASGWGHTADYHDWTVGLVREPDGSYVVATACEQDRRSDAAAKWRGAVLRLRPSSTHLALQTTDTSASVDSAESRATSDLRTNGLPTNRYSIEPISAGHRFPMGLARNHAGELFVTDNQGNFNPFNELNQVLPGKHFGFINAMDRGRGDIPELTEPAINIPHPWTRSVNGICFLETPPMLRQRFGDEYRHFGIFEGQLIGCEYDTRRLIRMSLQRVGDVMQGAAYPLSEYASGQGDTLLGPLTCAVAPDGDVYVGCLRDGGWGGANNTGTFVRLRMNSPRMPNGIAEVRALADGFQIRFTAPVDDSLASDPHSYRVSSYRRISTPAYGGDDVSRRNESISHVRLADDHQSVDIRLPSMRTGYVYEVRVNNLNTSRAKAFFPAEAFYTLHQLPAGPRAP